MATVTLSAKGEIVIPKKIREAAGLGPRSEATILFENGRIAILPKRDVVAEWTLFAKEHGEDLTNVDFDNILEEEEDEHVSRYKHLSPR
jgi:AbrB family looped-hinge helix DNA binding protein